MATELSSLRKEVGGSCIERKEDGGVKPPLQNRAGAILAAYLVTEGMM